MGLITKIYKCYDCGAILCLPYDPLKAVKCQECNKTMEPLDDDFDLSEIIEEE